MASRQISYIDKDVAADLQAREEMIRKSNQLGVPVIEVDGSIIIGFNRGRLDQLLGL